jgi:ribosome maturation factor RimP
MEDVMGGHEKGLAIEDAVAELVTTAVTPLSMVLEALEIALVGRRRVVRIAVDRDLSELSPDDTDSAIPPLTLDEVAEATTAISDALDTTSVLGDAPYMLECSSPGVGRPLTKPRHFRRNVGRLVTLTGTDGVKVTGRILSAGPDTFSLAVSAPAPSRKGAAVRPAVPTTHDMPYADVARAHVDVEFGHIDDEED